LILKNEVSRYRYRRIRIPYRCNTGDGEKLRMVKHRSLRYSLVPLLLLLFRTHASSGDSPVVPHCGENRVEALRAHSLQFLSRACFCFYKFYRPLPSLRTAESPTADADCCRRRRARIADQFLPPTSLYEENPPARRPWRAHSNRRARLMFRAVRESFSRYFNILLIEI
jgi:hypothetical protein